MIELLRFDGDHWFFVAWPPVTCSKCGRACALGTYRCPPDAPHNEVVCITCDPKDAREPWASLERIQCELAVPPKAAP